MIRCGCGNIDGQFVGLGKIHRLEIRPGFEQIGYQRDVPGKSMQLGNDERCPGQTAGSYGVRELWAAGFASAFNIGVFGNQLPPTA